MRVLLLERSDERGLVIEQALTRAGQRFVGRCRCLTTLQELATDSEADLVIADIASPGNEVLLALERISGLAARPIVLFTDDPDSHKIHAAVRAGVTSYVVGGFALDRIAPIVQVALARFDRDRSICAERDEARLRLAERKVIERAKGILMRKRGIDEDAAYHTLRRLAMDKSLRMREVAERVISMSDLLG